MEERGEERRLLRRLLMRCRRKSEFDVPLNRAIASASVIGRFDVLRIS